MPEQFIRVNRYVVSRSLSDGPGGDLTLRMTLFPHPDDEAPVDEALLFFVVGQVGGGVVTQGERSAVRAILPPTEFEHWYRILQSEKPVFLKWQERPDRSWSSISLSTAKEPPGEGIDQSS